MNEQDKEGFTFTAERTRQPMTRKIRVNKLLLLLADSEGGGGKTVQEINTDEFQRMNYEKLYQKQNVGGPPQSSELKLRKEEEGGVTIKLSGGDVTGLTLRLYTCVAH